MRMRVRNRVRFIRKNSEKKKTFRTFFYFFCKTIYINKVDKININTFAAAKLKFKADRYARELSNCRESGKGKDY